MLHDCVDYQQLTQFNARIDARNASIYVVLRAFVACFWHVSALRADLLYMCIAKSAHMVEMHYLSVDLRQTLFPFSLDPAFSWFYVFPAWFPFRVCTVLAHGLPGREPARVARVSAYRVY